MPDKRLLLVEDEPGLQLALSDRLSAEGYSVETAGDGNLAVTRATGAAAKRCNTIAGQPSHGSSPAQPQENGQ